jgi:hypothetical protein
VDRNAPRILDGKCSVHRCTVVLKNIPLSIVPDQLDRQFLRSCRLSGHQRDQCGGNGQSQ